jgi:hypothetical protein
VRDLSGGSRLPGRQQETQIPGCEGSFRQRSAGDPDPGRCGICPAAAGYPVVDGRLRKNVAVHGYTDAEGEQRGKRLMRVAAWGMGIFRRWGTGDWGSACLLNMLVHEKNDDQEVGLVGRLARPFCHGGREMGSWACWRAREEASFGLLREIAGVPRGEPKRTGMDCFC